MEWKPFCATSPAPLKKLLLYGKPVTVDQNFFADYYPYIFLLIGIVFLSFSILWESKNSKLKQTGICVEGIVFEQGSENNAQWSFNTPDHSSSVKDTITIRFLTEKHEWITGTMKQDFRVFYKGQYRDGNKVTVYYNRNDPSDFYVDTKQSEMTGRLIFGLVGIAFIVTGVYQLFLN
ncbi:MAG: DUF3592 domain-containing protein [Chitinophagaceae bacterium]|nr:DUF3592 domain-containing protein [Chitinophagaceae bacterium]